MTAYAALILLITATLASAQEAPVSARIESMDADGTCGAVLVAADRALTAAHCLHPDQTSYVLRSGAGNPGVRPISGSYRDPVYGILPQSLGRFRYDLALAVLPAGAGPVRPVPVGAPPVKGEMLAIETWRRGEDTPTRRECPVIEAGNGLILLGCPVVAGHSGAPVLRLSADGPEVVAVAVGRLTYNGQAVALAAVIGPRLALLTALADRG